MIGYIVPGTHDLPRAASFYDGQPAGAGNGTKTAIAANPRAQVDRIHARALELGGTDEGAPGPRAAGGDGFYAACFRDLDDNKLGVFSHG